MEQEGDLVASIYYGHISSQDTEQLLGRFGEDGSFLLRDSETLPGAFCLCVRKAPFVHTYRLVHDADGWALLANPPASSSSRQTFHRLETLIETYRTNSSAKMSIVPLIHPLDKTQLPCFSIGPEYLEMTTSSRYDV